MSTFIYVDIYPGGLFLKNAVGLNIYLSSTVLLSFTAIYTLLGFLENNGLNALWEKYPSAVPNATAVITSTSNNLSVSTMLFSTIVTMNTLVTGNVTSCKFNPDCYKVDPLWGHIFRPADDSAFPWVGLMFSASITGIWYWCTEQVIVQWTLGAKNIANAHLGTIITGFLKLLPLYIMVMPGMIVRALFANMVACGDPVACEEACGSKYGCSNEAYPQLVLWILPQGLVGLMLAVMITALMSSLSSAFNSSSTIFTMDIYKVVQPKASNRELLIVRRLVVCILVVVGLVWIPTVSRRHSGHLFTYLQTIQSYLTPPTCAVFLVGMLWPQLTEKGTLTSMLFGLFMACTRLGFDVAYPKPHCGTVDNKNAFAKLHFRYYALIITAICVAMMVIISFFTQPVPLEMLGALTWKTINKPRYREGVTSEEYIVSADLKLEEANIKDQVQIVGSKTIDSR